MRDLSKVSIIYQDSTINQFSININSKVSIPEFPIKLIDNQITLNSISSNKETIFDESNHNDSFIYIESYTDRTIEGQLNHMYGPFLIGPKSFLLKTNLNLSLKIKNSTQILEFLNMMYLMRNGNSVEIMSMKEVFRQKLKPVEYFQ